MEGWIKLHRSLLEWEWYSDINISRLFIHTLLKANFKDKNWQGITVERGSFITSTETLANETGLSIQQVRTILKKLESTNEIIVKRTNKFTLIKVVNYRVFQELGNDEQQENNNQITSNQQTDNNQITNEQQTDNNQITTTKEVKKEKNEKNEKKEESEGTSASPPAKGSAKEKYGEFGNVLLSADEYKNLVDSMGDMLTSDYIERLGVYIASTGKEYKSHYATILNWTRKDSKEKAGSIAQTKKQSLNDQQSQDKSYDGDVWG